MEKSYFVKFKLRKAVIIVLLLVIILSGMFYSTNRLKESALAQEIDFEFYFLVDGNAQIDLEDIDENINDGDDSGFLVVEMYVSAISAESYEVGTITGSFYFNKNYFSLQLPTYVASADNGEGRFPTPYWTVDSGYMDLEEYDDRVMLGFVANIGSNTTIGQDTLISTIYLKCLEVPQESMAIRWDFNDDPNPGNATFNENLGGTSTRDYVATDNGRISDTSNILFTPFWIGEPPQGEACAELESLSLKEYGGEQTEYIKSFNVEERDFTTWQIPYTNSVSGMQLSYTAVSNSAEVSVSFNEGSQAQINENKIIIGLVDGDEIIVTVTDGEDLEEIYTIEVSVMSASNNAKLSNITAYNGTYTFELSPQFDADTEEYVLSIPYKYDKVTLAATPQESTSTVSISGSSVTSAVFDNLQVGIEYPKVIKVIAEDGLTEKEYTVTITRQEASTEVGLESILVNGGQVNMPEESTEFSYLLDEEQENYVFEIIGKVPSLQTIAYRIGDSSNYTQGTNSGSARPIAKNGTVMVRIRVTAQAGNTEEYLLTIQRKPSTNNELGNISIKQGYDTKQLVAMNDVYTYVITPTGDTITISASGKIGENSTIQVFNDDNVQVYDSEDTESYSGIINIVDILPGIYEYTIKVLPQDVHAIIGEYRLEIIKKSGENELSITDILHTNNNDADIEGLDYDESTSTYSLTIDYELDNVVVNKIRIKFTGSKYGIISGNVFGEGVGIFVIDTPVSNNPRAHADITFNSTARVEMTCEIAVTAQNGEVRNFILYITRKAANSDCTLETLTINESPVNGFDRYTYIYETPIILSGDTASVTVFGKPNSLLSTVTYNNSESGLIALTRGQIKDITIKVTAQSGAVQDYKIKVIPANTNNAITNIELEDTHRQLIPGLSFDPENTGPYSITVAHTIDYVTIIVSTPSDAGSTVTGKGTEHLSVGNNSFKVYATSEAGIKGKEYTINISRNSARTDCFLDSLTVSSGTGSSYKSYISEFNSENTSYDIRVDRDISSLKIEATVPDNNGSNILSGLNSNYTWTGTSTTIEVLVRAEDITVTRTYRVYVVRANNNNTITDIEIDNQGIAYNALTYEYTLNPVAFAKDSLNLNVLLADSRAKLFTKINNSSYILQSTPSSFDISIATGVNSIQLYVLSEYTYYKEESSATPDKIYKINITRELASNNARLSNLEILVGGENKLTTFQSSEQSYELRLNNNITSIGIEAEAQHAKAKITITPSSRTLEKGLNTFSILVEAEDSDTTLTYTVKIFRANDDDTISNISVDTDTEFIYNINNFVYALSSVPFATDKAIFNVSLNDNSAKVFAKINNGSRLEQYDIDAIVANLVAGQENIINIYAISEYQYFVDRTFVPEDVYQFKITRNIASSNAKLAILEVKVGEEDLLVGDNQFDQDKTLYELRVDRDVTSININATAQDSGARVNIPANLNLNVGLKVFTISVIAEDNSSLEYEIQVTRANDINKIMDIKIDSSNIGYSQTKFLYELGEVAFSKKKIEFDVTLQDSYSKLYLKVNNSTASLQLTPEKVEVLLNSGDNEIILYVVSEYGTTGAEYMFTVSQKQANDNATLSSLQIKVNGDNIDFIDEEFNSLITNYNARVDNDISLVNFVVTTTDVNATYTITPTGGFLEENKKNTFYIDVVAESGDAKRYTVNIYRANDNNTITELKVNNTVIPLIPGEIISLLTFENSISQITITAKREDTSAKLYGGGIQEVPVGEKVFEIYAVSQYGELIGLTKDDVDVYYIKTTRKALSNDNKLEGLTVYSEDDIVLPFDSGVEFIPERYNYTITLSETYEQVRIDAVAQDNNKEVAGDFGWQQLQPSHDGSINKQFVITVTSESGIPQNYTINITKGTVLSNDSSIKSVTLKDTSNNEYLEFDSSVEDFGTINVIYKTHRLILTVTPNDNRATVSMTQGGYIDLNAGSSVNVVFQVTAQDGTSGQQYKFSVYREAANVENYLEILKVKDYESGYDYLDGIFNSESSTNEYNIRVDDNVEKVIIEASVPTDNDSAIISNIEPFYNLVSSQVTSINIFVRAEDMSVRTYTIKVLRANSDNRIKEMLIGDTVVPIGDFILRTEPSEHYYYLADAVIFSNNKINIEAILEDIESNATITGAGLKTLEVGENSFNIYATAQDGTRGNKYVIRIDRLAQSSEAVLKSLLITSEEETLLEVDSDIAFVYNFSKNRNLDSITITALPSHEGAVVAGDTGQINLIGGITNILKIYVTAENNTQKVYTINIDIKDDDTKILDISTNLEELSFGQDKFLYTLEDVEYNIDSIMFSFELNSSFSNLYINTKLIENINLAVEELQVGENVFNIYAMAENEEIGQTYQVVITREGADENNYLSSLNVSSGGEQLELLPLFHKDVTEYTIMLSTASTISHINIEATAENGSTPQGVGLKELTEIGEGMVFNIFDIIVTAENDSTKKYTITVIKAQSGEISNDYEIKNISLVGGGYEFLDYALFNPNTSRQDDIIIPYNINYVFLSITAHEKARVFGQGSYSINEGQTITIEFWVVAENNLSGIHYKVDVTREIASTNNTLEDLYYEVDGFRVTLDADETNHVIFLNYAVNSILLGGELPDGASASGFGEFSLPFTITTKVINVRAENGEIKNYVLTITKQSDDASIKSIKMDDIEIIEEFDEAFMYQKTVPYSQTNAHVIAVANNSNAIISGNSNYILEVGENTINVYAVSEAGTQGQVYTIKVFRQSPDSNNYLSRLTVKDAHSGEVLLLQPEFLKTTMNYTVNLTNYSNVQEIEIEAKAESTKAKQLEGAGIFILRTEEGASTEIFNVTVTAENNTSRRYSITIIRNINPNDDVSIAELSFFGNDAVNYLGTASTAKERFQLSRTSYSITVPFKVNNATLTIINNNGANIYGNENYDLSYERETIIEFYLVSKSGNNESAVYTIIVTRNQPSDIDTLSSLTVNGELIPGFDADITSYEIIVATEEISSAVIEAVATDEQASVIGDLGQINLDEGTNTINVTVKAESGIRKVYTLIIKRLSIDNTLSYLGVENFEITPEFRRDTHDYSLTVPYTTEMVNVEAMAYPSARITGAGTTSLQVGDNAVEVFVTSAQGQDGEIYTINIHREMPSSDNTLKSLFVSSGTGGELVEIKPSFRPDITKYIINLKEDSEINTLTINGEANCPYAQVGGFGYKVLEAQIDGDYITEFPIVVSAQDGSTRTYTITIYRNVELSDDITITKLSLIGSDGVNYLGTESTAKEIFAPNVYSYSITVPYNVDAITLDIETYTATVYGKGQKVFGQQSRVTFTAYLVSQNGEVESDQYNITVNRMEPGSDNTLRYIKINGEDVLDFDTERTQYELDIPYLSTERIIISALPTHPTAIIISGTGSFDIREGRNIFNILVKAQNGDTLSYNLVVNYLNNNAFLDNLSLEGAREENINDNNSIAYPFTFIPDTFNYVVTVDKDIRVVLIKGQAQDQDKAAIIGLGKYTLEGDRTTITINVIAADNTTTKSYKINVVKTTLPSANTRLRDLQVQGGYSPLGFNPDNHTYSMRVNSTTEYLEINAIPEDPNSKVTIIGNEFIDAGKNVILVQVEAEDGTVGYYHLNVNKNPETIGNTTESDSFLTLILILIFLMLLIIFLYRVKTKNKEETPKYNLKGFTLTDGTKDGSIDLNNIGEERKKWQI